MLVGIGMVKGQAGGGKGIELRGDFGPHLRARGGIERDAKGGAHHIGVKQAIASHQRGDAFGWQDGAAIGQHHMQANP